MIAVVVPVLRLRRDTTGWSYQVPPNQEIHVGSLVIIPFRQKQCLGVVWELQRSDDLATSKITTVLTPQPLLREPHRQVVEHISQVGLCSLSSALYVWLPRALRQYPLTASTRRHLDTYTRFQPSNAFISSVNQQAICVAGRRDAQAELYTQKLGTNFYSLFQDESVEKELGQWLAIAQGQGLMGLGREGVLFAPWLNLRQLTVIDPEDISYYHEQIPYYNLTSTARFLGQTNHGQLHFRSYLPTPAAQLLWGEHSSGNDNWPTRLGVVDLKHEALLSEPLIAAIHETLQDSQEIVIVYNAHDRWAEPEAGSIGRTLRAGVESTRKQLAKALHVPELPRNIHFGTRSILHQRYPRVGLTIALNINHLLESPLFADQLHGWTDLGHLFAYSSRCLIQTHYPEHPLVRSLLESNWSSFVLEKLARRQELGLPPFAQQIVCSLAETNMADAAAERLYHSLNPLLHDPWQISLPFVGEWRKKTYRHLLLTAPRDARLATAARHTLVSLTRPWKLEVNPWHVL